MLTPIVAVALRTVRHNDRSSILTAWSASQGRLSLVLPDGKGPSSRRLRAVTMPLGLFEGVADIRPGRELIFVRDVKQWSGAETVNVDVSSHPVRSTVAIFVAEIIGVVTREGDGDTALWNLITETVGVIARGSAVALANIPVAFLFRLASILGVEPDIAEFSPGMGLDLQDGVFRRTRPLHDFWVGADEARGVTVLAEAFDGYRHAALVRLPRSVRSRLLDGMIKFFTLHHFPLDKLRSPEILKAVFAD